MSTIGEDKVTYKANNKDSIHIQESEKDSVILLSKKFLLGKVPSKYLSILEKDDDDEPGN